MRVLIAWDVPREAELIALYLNTAENQAVSCLTAGEVLARAELGPWDAVLMSLTFPKTADEGYELFTKLGEALPGVPVVVGCRPSEMFALPRFLTHGLRFYINRDDRGDFIFLVLSCVSSAVAATHAEEARKLAARLREEMDGVRRLQESIIPHGVRPPSGYRVAARYEPSQVSVVGDRPVVRPAQLAPSFDGSLSRCSTTTSGSTWRNRRSHWRANCTSVRDTSARWSRLTRSVRE